ncbi:MAG TPA: DUF4012 domain-containing protein [Candidatus Woesebacteria bacterium]|nr:DUF4012 domain-containing protein [Candidatus Woesebacteria bacterium]
MPAREALVSISSNNPHLEDYLVKDRIHPDLKFTKHSPEKNNYLLFFIDLSQNLNDVSQSLISAYSLCREKGVKLIVTILHNQEIDTEKNHYFQKMLDDLGKNNPLHRLVLCKDLYQYQSSQPITPFDLLIQQSTAIGEIKISQKGEDCFYPLSINDYLTAIAKIFFLNTTSGNTFWIVGDPTSDLELAYLLKKLYQGPENFEINATKENNPQSSSLKNLSTKAKAELNWETSDDIADTISGVVAQYQANKQLDISTKPSKKRFEKLALWLAHPTKPKEKTKLITPKKIIKKTIQVLIAVYCLIAVGFLAFTYIALQNTRQSARTLLNGDVSSSVKTLKNAHSAESIGESLFNFIDPALSFISPSSSQKIYNLFSFINYTQSSIENIQQTYILAETLYHSLNSQEENTNYTDLSLALHTNLSQIYENVNQISFLSSNHRLPSLVETKLIESSELTNLQLLEEQIVQYIKLSDLIPFLVGENTPQNILFVMQNNQILKPNGGEVDYFLLLNIFQGRLSSYQFYKPSEIELLYQNATNTKAKDRLAKKTTISIKDIAQNPDFSLASPEIVSYFETAIKIKPNFIVAVNNLLFEDLLAEEDANELELFKARIITENGVDEYQKVVDEYLNRFFNHQIPLPILGRVIAKVINNNQVLFWSSDTSVERIISTQSFSGIIGSHPCQTGITGTQKCFSESGYLSEGWTNTKNTTPWSNRTVSHTITLSATQNTHEYKVEYLPNPLSSTVSSAINYHLYLSAPSTLDQIYLDNLPYSMKNVIKENIHQLDHYTISIDLENNQARSVSFKMTTTSASSLTAPSSYSFTEYRQPGTVDPGINLSINYPDSLKVSVVTQTADFKPQSLNLILPPSTTTFGLSLIEKME